METVSATSKSGPGNPHQPKSATSGPRLKRGLRGRCPAAAKASCFAHPQGGRSLFGLRAGFPPHRADDLPAYLVIVIVGHIVYR